MLMKIATALVYAVSMFVYAFGYVHTDRYGAALLSFALPINQSEVR